MIPLVTPIQTSPWDNSYPMRPRSAVQPVGYNVNEISNISPSLTISKRGSQPSFRDQGVSPTTSAGSGSVGANSVVNSRTGSLSSLALPSHGSIGSFNQSEMDSPLSMWQNDDPTKLRPAVATLTVSNLPTDLTLRESQFIFALASDLLSVDVSRNAVSGDVTLTAKFSAAHSAQAAGVALERRPDIFGSDLKVNVQAFAPNFGAQQGQRSIYQQRPLFSESPWSQQPISPLSTSASDMLNTQRRSSSLVQADQLAQINLSGSSTPQSSSFDSGTVLRSTTPTKVSPHGSVSSGSNASDSHRIPPPNPADQNPPCNTLYVGNLPPDTSETELKDLFSRQPGYRRLCFRTKQNGPMCFVEFEDETYAGKTLVELYGVALSNSVKGGIRLSYSKNPLGVKSRTPRTKNVQ